MVFNVELVKSLLKITQRNKAALAYTSRYAKQRQQKYKVVLMKLFFAFSQGVREGSFLPWSTT